MKSIKKLFVLFLFTLLSACSEQRLPPIPENGVVLAFGDSLTAGVGAEPADDYPTVLGELTGLHVVNSGVSGETTDEGLKRLPGVLDRHNPSLMILLEGGNDILRNMNRDQVRDNLSQMIKLAKDRDISVVLIGVPEKKLFSDSAPLYQELADYHDVPLESSILADLLRSLKYKSDPIHLNDAGYLKLAERLQQWLEENGAIN